jgi:hypothetical protein
MCWVVEITRHLPAGVGDFALCRYRRSPWSDATWLLMADFPADSDTGHIFLVG